MRGRGRGRGRLTEWSVRVPLDGFHVLHLGRREVVNIWSAPRGDRASLRRTLGILFEVILFEVIEGEVDVDVVGREGVVGV